MVIWLWFIVSVYLTTPIGTSAGEAKGPCVLDQHKYDVGQTWHPVLKPIGLMVCVNCTCLKGGKVECVSEKCPRPNCPEPKHLPGKCCPVCQDHVEDDDVTSEPLPGCEFNGKQFEDGEVFPSNKTGLKPTRNDQCVMCVCSMGYVLCHLKTCLPVKCRKVVITEDDCCPSCDDMNGYHDGYYDGGQSHSIMADPVPTNLSRADCKAMGYKENSTSWHPVVGIFGEIKCITCRCLNGRIECVREECPRDDKLSCKKPVQLPGECCKSCPKRGRKHRERQKGKRKNKNGKKKRNKRKKDKTRKRKRKRKKAPAPSPDTHEQTVQNSLNFPCLPRKTDRLVYFSEKKKSLVLAVSLPSLKQVELHKWTVRKGRLTESNMVTVSLKEFNNSYNFLELKGATNKRRHKKLKKKLTKKLSRCDGKCRKKVVLNIVKRLKTKPVTFSAKCK